MPTPESLAVRRCERLLTSMSVTGMKLCKPIHPVDAAKSTASSAFFILTPSVRNFKYVTVPNYSSMSTRLLVRNSAARGRLCSARLSVHAVRDDDNSQSAIDDRGTQRYGVRS